MARIAMPVAQDFEDSELRVPLDRLRQAGHEVLLVGARAGERVSGKRGKEMVTVELAASDARAEQFDALVIPGGYSPDHLRLDPAVVRFVRDFTRSGKLVAAVCHGPQLLIEADAVRGRTVTSWPSVRKDLENAGAKWIDREVVEDGNLVTSRKPDDLEAFSRAVARRLADPAGIRDVGLGGVGA
jgi:protease I